MGTLSSPAGLASLYILAAIVFAIVYTVMWRLNPDSFIVHEEMNLRPLKVGRLRWPPRRDSQTVSAPNPTGARLETIYDQLVDIQSSETKLEKDLTELDREIPPAKAEATRIAVLHNAEMARNIQAFTEQNRPSEGQIELALKQYRDKLTFSMSEDERSRVQKKLDDDFDRLFKSTAMPTLGEFAKTSVAAAFDQAFKDRDALEDRHLTLSDELLRLRMKRRELLEAWENRRVQRLGFFDFLYFSMGVATSNTFGDIIPNDRIIRVAIVAQLLLSVLLVGLFIDAITKG
jgi:hypothetical protein